MKAVEIVDRLGRESETQQFESATVYISVKSSYDGMGRLSQVTNPFRGTETGRTTTQFDWLGRVKSITYADGSIETHTPVNNQETVLISTFSKIQQLAEELWLRAGCQITARQWTGGGRGECEAHARRRIRR